MIVIVLENFAFFKRFCKILVSRYLESIYGVVSYVKYGWNSFWGKLSFIVYNGLIRLRYFRRKK